MKETQSFSRRSFLGRTASVGTAALAGSLTVNLVHRGEAAAPADQKPYQIGFYTRPWDKFDYRAALDAIAETGVKYVGLMTAGVTAEEPFRSVLSNKNTLEDAANVGAEAKKRGLQILSLWGGNIRAEKGRQQAAADLRQMIDLSAAAESASFLLGGIDKPELYDAYYGAVADCCDYAAEKKLGLSVKPHGGLNATGAQLRKTIEQVGSKNFAVYYDPGNVFHYSQGKIDPLDDVTSLDGLISGLVVKDYRSGPESADVWVTPGTGKVDFPALLAKLKKGGFQSGPILVETLNRSDPKNLTALLAEAKKARKFLEALVRG